jgi:CheY-like chemotaxis protein
VAKILVVDDSKLITDVLKTTFEAMGHQVVCAMDAYQALSVANSAKPQLITLDFNMPAGNGDGLYKRLRAVPSLAHIPVIFISSIGPEAVAAMLQADSLVRFVPKPVDAAKLKDVSDELLGVDRPAPGTSVPI